MKSAFLRYQKQEAEVPCDAYPDGTVVTAMMLASEAPVFKLE